MKLLKPNWVSHDGNPIFSVDLHPDGSRFATGGQGDGGSSGRVVVWNTSPVINPKDEHNENVPKVLCIMDNHLACVNCVRWSCNGRYLASGGDDKIIMIWQFGGYGRATTFGSSDMQASNLNGERWRVAHTLKRHTGDILHLAWSPNDQWLASCSIDNTVVVWNALRFPEVTTVLRGHTSLVKGVTWDPVGTYIASQSDDKSIKIWKTLDWKQEATIAEPFEECGATTHVLRLDWSPDGGYLVSAHAMNNSGPTSQIIERAGWKTNMDFVGHRKAITCTRFNGRMFRRHQSKSKDKPRLPYTCCAIGSRDRSLSVWLTSLRRPLVVVNDLFDDSVMDISWSYLGYSLLCCSWDGSVAYLEFKPEEIGEALSREEMNELHKKTYGKSMSIQSQPLIIENPAMLAIQQKKAEENAMGDEKKTPPEPKTPTKHPTKQVEVRTPNGKRRITPIFVAAQEELGSVPRPFGSAFGSSTSLSSNLSKSPSKTNRFITPEKKKSDSEKLNISQHASTSGLKPSSSDINKAATSNTEVKDKTKTITILSNGQAVDTTKPKNVLTEKNNLSEQQKKSILDHRIAEKSPSSVGDASYRLKAQRIPVKNKLEKKLHSDKKSPSNKDVVSTKDTTDSILPLPTQVQSKKSGKPPGFSAKRKANEGTATPGDSPKQPKRVKKDHNILTPGQARHQTPAQQSLLSKLTLPLPAPVPLHKLPPRKIPKMISVQISETDSPATVKLHNDSRELQSQKSSKNIATLHKIICSEGTSVQWESVIPSPGLAMHGNKDVVGVVCEDCTLRMLSSTSGRQLVPTICTRAKPYDVKCNGWNIMVVCCDASLSVWDLKYMKSLISNQSFANLVPECEKSSAERRKSREGGATNEQVHSSDSTKENSRSPLRHCEVTGTGMPLLTFENTKSYTFSKDMMTWVLVDCLNESIEQCADHKTNTGNAPKGILDSVRRKATGVGACALKMFHTNAPTQRSATVVFLENRVETCVALNSSTEYRYWLLAYIRHLVNEGLDVRLREMCDDMLGPTHVRSHQVTSSKLPANTIWKPFVLGIFKRTLLRDEILPIIGSNLNFQRLYTEYQDQLDVCMNSGSILSG